MELWIGGMRLLYRAAGCAPEVGGPCARHADLPDHRTVPTTDDDSRDDDWTDADSTDGDAGRDGGDGDCTGYCPDCGAEVYDDADVCPKCFTWLNGETARHPPSTARRRERTRAIVVWITIAAILVGAGILWFVR
jgi:hypothetical protein